MINPKYLLNAEEVISKCRPGDWEHAKRVVRLVELLAEVDPKMKDLLIKAAYIHDIGWCKLLPDGLERITKDNLLEYEKIANRKSTSNATKFLSEQNESPQDIKIILRLIKATDDHKSNDDLEAIIVDADLLSKLDINHFKQKYAEKDWKKMFGIIKNDIEIGLKLKESKEIYSSRIIKLEEIIFK